MKPVPAKNEDISALQNLGRVTLQVVHDLKNQLNGLKLYATFLRKRLERDDRSPEERETLTKLISGLDRAARDLTALVQYARGFELHRQPRTDLTRVVSGVMTEVTRRESGELPRVPISSNLQNEALLGNFDPALLAEALKSITDEAVNSVSTKDGGTISVQLCRDPMADPPAALVEWKGMQPHRNHTFGDLVGHGTVQTAVAAKIIEAHGGKFQSEDNLIRAWLPLSDIS